MGINFPNINIFTFFIVDILIYSLPILPNSIYNRAGILFLYYILYLYRINIYYINMKELYFKKK